MYVDMCVCICLSIENEDPIDLMFVFPSSYVET